MSITQCRISFDTLTSILSLCCSALRDINDHCNFIDTAYYECSTAVTQRVSITFVPLRDCTTFLMKEIVCC